MQRLPSPRVNNVIRGLACHYAREQPALRCSFLAEVLKRSNSLRSGGTESTAHGLSSLVADAERLGSAQHIKDTARPRRATIASFADISPDSGVAVKGRPALLVLFTPSTRRAGCLRATERSPSLTRAVQHDGTVDRARMEEGRLVTLACFTSRTTHWRCVLSPIPATCHSSRLFSHPDLSNTMRLALSS